MTDEVRFDRFAREWLELGPVEAPSDVIQAAFVEINTTTQERDLRVPWRIGSMPTIARALAGAFLVALAVGGVFLVRQSNRATVAAPTSSPTATPQPAASVPPVGDLTEAYRSDRYGYTIHYPAGWFVTPATRSWQPGTETPWGDPSLDALEGPSARLVAAAQPLGAGQSPDAWYQAYCGSGGTKAATCGRAIEIGTSSGFVTLDGVPALAGTIRPGGPIFDAVAVFNGFAYEFTLDGDVDSAAFARILAAVELDPGMQVHQLSQTYTSERYGYSILIDPRWTVAPATTRRTDPLSEETDADTITVTGTDSSIGASAARLGNRSWDQLLTSLRQGAIGSKPAGCDGGDPTTWPSVAVGARQGRLQQFCNGAAVYVLDGTTVYEFDWDNTTFNAGQHLTQANFLEVLKGVTLPGTVTPDASSQP